MVAEAEFCHAIPDKQKILQLYQNPNAFAFLDIKDDEIIGFISGIVGEYFFSKRKKISDLGFYVLPEYRGSKTALKLLKEYESWAKLCGVDDIHLGQTTAIDIEKTQNFYNRLGYKTVGFNTVKHLRE